MTSKDKIILNKIQIKLPNYDIEIIVKALELYITNIKHCYRNDFLDSKTYDDFYFTCWCLYHIFLNNLDYEELQNIDRIEHKRFCEIPLYKRITKDIVDKNLQKYKEYYKEVA